MGVEYYIVDDEHKECFELGKGNWKDLPLNNKDSMIDFMIEFVKPGFEAGTTDDYFVWLSEKVLKFVNNRNVVILNDTQFWSKYYLNPEYHTEDDGTVWCPVIDDRYEE